MRDRVVSAQRSAVAVPYRGGMTSFHCVLSPDGIARGSLAPRWPTTAEDLFQLLGCSVELAPGTTVADLVRVVRIDTPALLSPLFACDIPAFLDSLDQPRDDDAEPSGMTEVRFHLAWHGGRKGEAPGELSWECDGWGVWPVDEAHPEGPREGGFAIDFSPLAELVQYPVRLIDTAEIAQADAPPVVVRQVPRLYDLLQAFWWEVGFHGSPTNTAAQLASLRSSLLEVDLDQARVAEGLPSRLIPADEVFARLRQQLGLPAAAADEAPGDEDGDLAP